MKILILPLFVFPLGSPTDANEVHLVGGAEAEVALMSAWRSVGATFLPNAKGSPTDAKTLAFASDKPATLNGCSMDAEWMLNGC